MSYDSILEQFDYSYILYGSNLEFILRHLICKVLDISSKL